MAAKRRGKSERSAPSLTAGAAPALLHLQVGDVGRPGSRADDWRAVCELAVRMGVNGLLLEPLWQRAGDARGGAGPQDGSGDAAPADADTASNVLGGGPMTELLGQLAQQAREHGLVLLMEVVLDRAASEAAPGTADPAWLLAPQDDPARDPRLSPAHAQVLPVRTDDPPAAYLQAWQQRLTSWLDAGVAGFCFDAPQRLRSPDWARLIGALREHAASARAYAWTHGLSPEQLAPLQGAGFDAVFSSLPWWDYRADWFLQEDHRLRAIAPVIAPVGLPGSPPHADRRALWAAALSGDGMLLPARTQLPPGDIAAALDYQRRCGVRSVLHAVAGGAGHATALVRRAVAASCAEEPAKVLLINPDDQQPAQVRPGLLAHLLPPALPSLDEGNEGWPASLAPGAVQRVDIPTPQPVLHDADVPATRKSSATRLAIEQVGPAVDDGAFPPKTVAGRPLGVHADLIYDGHDILAGEVRWRALDETGWHSAPLQPLGNDLWQAMIVPARVGRHEFVVSAWHDGWSSYTYELRKKHDAGVATGVELMDGAALLRAAAARGKARQHAAHAGVVKQALLALGDLPAPAAEGERLSADALPAATAERVAVLLDPAVADAMRALDDRAFQTSSASYPLWVDRPQAEFASWYELFPRSQAAEPGRHGTFADVTRRLPALREMGFDVLYFPPIHPIGTAHRKGPNNSLTAQPDDVGSPYAIGSPEGGHDALHPELGGLPEFLALVHAARQHGLEVALDFAIQCSPDHPWLREHPDWFTRRADGTIRYAENPPKKYQDIVNVSFYDETGKRARKSALWEALRDVVAFWVAQGVRIFRVDNPHTKPLPFWQWLIADIQRSHPDVLFLSEAFTRPKMMYRLAKVGFTQSYTYFTWRNGKQELIDYLLELSRPPVSDFFRPNFFVNTPDINPYFLQSSGRAGFLIRAALAATSSGLWGVYSGFELCEGAPVPGKEEYLDSEKYQLRQRDWNQPGNINAQIARLNLIRRQNPALQSHRGFSVVDCANPNLLCFYKATPCGGNVVLVAISLDPHHAQGGELRLPRWLPQGAPAVMLAHDLLDGATQRLEQAGLGVHLTPDQPYRVWRLTAVE